MCNEVLWPPLWLASKIIKLKLKTFCHTLSPVVRHVCTTTVQVCKQWYESVPCYLERGILKQLWAWERWWQQTFGTFTEPMSSILCHSLWWWLHSLVGHVKKAFHVGGLAVLPELWCCCPIIKGYILLTPPAPPPPLKCSPSENKNCAQLCMTMCCDPMTNVFHCTCGRDWWKPWRNLFKIVSF